MDANFINTVASGQGIPCPNCNTMNEADSLFCFVCGTKLAVTPTAFEPVETTETTNAFAPVETTETTNAFAPVTETVSEKVNNNVAPAFTPVNEVKAEEPVVKAPEVVKPVSNYVEPESVFAQGLPEWSVEPPQVVVRRHKRV